MIFIITSAGQLMNFTCEAAVRAYESIWGAGYRRVSESEWNSHCPAGDRNFDHESTPDGV